MNGFGVVMSVLYVSLFFYLCQIIRNNHRREEAAAAKAKRDASVRANDAWGEVFYTIQNEHAREVLQLKNDAMQREIAMQDEIKALKAQVDHYEAELSRINLINGKLWNVKKEELINE